MRAARALEARRERGRLAEVPAQDHRVHARVAPLELDERLARAVAAAVVDQHQLERPPERRRVPRRAAGAAPPGCPSRCRAGRRRRSPRAPRRPCECEYKRRPRAAVSGRRPPGTPSSRPRRRPRPRAAREQVRGSSSTPSAFRCGSSARSATRPERRAPGRRASSRGSCGRRPTRSSAKSRPSARVEPQVGHGRPGRELEVAERERQAVEVEQAHRERPDGADRREDQAERRTLARHEPHEHGRGRAPARGVSLIRVPGQAGDRPDRS